MRVALTNTQSEDIFVLVADPAARFAIPKSNHIRVFSKVDDKRLANAHNIFVVTTGLYLSRVAEFVKTAHSQKRLGGLLVRQENNQNWLPFLLGKAGLGKLKNLLIYSDYAIMKRVLAAWGMYFGQNNLIADAAIMGETLFVRDCVFNHYEVALKQINGFSKVSPKDRSSFVISEEGGQISWPDYDIDLGMDSIHCIVNPEPFKELAHKYNISYGLAIQKLRTQKKVRQYQIPGISERHLRRIEKGEIRANYKCLKALAKAHKMTAEDYLSKLAQLR